MFGQTYKNKTVLVTGHTGFKGSWLCIWLLELGAKVIGYGLDPYTPKDNFVVSGLAGKMTDIRADIRDTNKLAEVFTEYKPDIVFHLAAQPLVRLSYDIPVETYEVNLIGTLNVLEQIRRCDQTKAGVMITTDKCYENKEQIWGYKETDPMGGFDPYSSSKGACEIAISSWRNSFFNPAHYGQHGKSIASARAGNVIGGGDWAQDRILPDCIRALENNISIEIRSPMAIRPWQHVLEPVSGYLLLGKKMLESDGSYGEGWNFGPAAESVLTVRDVADKVIRAYGTGSMREAQNNNQLHEAQLLSLDISKARFKLGWTPTLNIDETIQMTVDWYLQYKTVDGYQQCVDQISSFSQKKAF